MKSENGLKCSIRSVNVPGTSLVRSFQPTGSCRPFFNEKKVVDQLYLDNDNKKVNKTVLGLLNYNGYQLSRHFRAVYLSDLAEVTILLLGVGECLGAGCRKNARGLAEPELNRQFLGWRMNGGIYKTASIDVSLALGDMNQGYNLLYKHLNKNLLSETSFLKPRSFRSSNCSLSENLLNLYYLLNLKSSMSIRVITSLNYLNNLNYRNQLTVDHLIKPKSANLIQKKLRAHSFVGLVSADSDVINLLNHLHLSKHLKRPSIHPNLVYNLILAQRSVRASESKQPILRSMNLRKQHNSLHQPNPQNPPTANLNLSVYREYANERHRTSWMALRLRISTDVEENPGPVEKSKSGDLLVTSYNVRGLNDDHKLRHLINHCYSTLGGKDKDSIYLFQETYIPVPGKIPYLWRGNFHLTPGEGNSCGCLTLLSSHLNIIEAIDIGNRAHVLACQKIGETGVGLVIANIYAPNPNTNEKIDFFEEVFEKVFELVEKFDSRKIIIAGDYNLIFRNNESKNRLFTMQEKRVAEYVKDCNRIYNLSDLWGTNSTFTWRRPNSEIFSTIDRMAFSGDTLTLLSKKVNWSLSMSDHAAVEVAFDYKTTKQQTKSKVTRLDPSLLKIPAVKDGIERELRQMLGLMSPDWNPHLKLEYSKMCLRTVVEKAQAELKRKEKTEEEFVNEELNLAVKSLASSVGDYREKERLIEYVEELRGQKAGLIEAKGERLAERLGTRWYNEGEKSNKYFLRLLRRSVPDSFNVLEDREGNIIVDENEIEKQIVSFYRDLYEDYDRSKLNSNVDDDVFNNIESLAAADEAGVVQAITKEELLRTLRTCSDSTPGPDGIPYSYLQVFWDIFGQLIAEAWQHSLATGNLTQSHKTSFLKLIPKQGKNLKDLANWRPITLSNCDHKIITKTYANRLCAQMTKVINERQTAYLKGRLINDNVRAMIATIGTANFEENVDAILTSLDAKKAFDSVEHSYIRECLIKFGLPNFVNIFKILYYDLKSDIVVNGKIVNGFRIKRGVKQGDALSCILFIICMEPLLANIEINQNIKRVRSETASCDLPKIYAYADDVNALIANYVQSLQELFNEYGRLTNKSGLELNANKTEIMPFASNGYNEQNFDFLYLGKQHRIKSKKEVKVNGVLLQQDRNLMKASNVEHVIARMQGQLRAWSARQLTLMGKILILKTYGVSQVVYLLQSITLEPVHFKRLNEILYKFLWNKRFAAAKAPDRIRREIINTSTKFGVFGMLDLKELDDGLKLRAIGRLLETRHPFLKLIKNSISHENFFFPEIKLTIEEVAVQGVKLLLNDRIKALGEGRLEGNRSFLGALKNSTLKSVVTREGRGSLIYFNLRAQNKLRLNDLNGQEIDSLRRFMDNRLYEALDRTRALRADPQVAPNEDLIFYRGKPYALSKLTSRELRTYRKSEDPICIY